MAVMMQGFYRDCAIKEEKKGEWWNFLNEEIAKLGKEGAGFDFDLASLHSQNLSIQTRTAMTNTTISTLATTIRRVPSKPCNPRS